MNYYQIVAFAQHLKKENMNNNFTNDPNEFTTDVMNEDSLMNQYFREQRLKGWKLVNEK